MFLAFINKIRWSFYQIIKIQKKLRWEKYRRLGMIIGDNVNLPMSTWIDISHCYLISIGDNCGFGEMCALLAHDAMPNEYINATKIGRIKINESCHFGIRTVILPGVEIGPMSIVGANSVVTTNIPPHSVAVGNPAKVICSLEDYLEKHKRAMGSSPLFEFNDYTIERLNELKKRELVDKMSNTNGYIVGGYSAGSK